jgi:hypothetical protein
MLVLNLFMLKTIEDSFKDSNSCYNSLQIMIDQVLNWKESSFKFAPDNIKLAIKTLKNFKVLEEIDEEDSKTKLQHLNS